MVQNKRIFSSVLPQEDGMRGIPLVELLGQNRVLIENHLGVMAYSTEEICVRVKYGMLCVCGFDLQLTRMTKQQLLIAGCIQQIRLMGGR